MAQAPPFDRSDAGDYSSVERESTKQQFRMQMFRICQVAEFMLLCSIK
jgi:hypothetical protein